MMNAEERAQYLADLRGSDKDKRVRAAMLLGLTIIGDDMDIGRRLEAIKSEAQELMKKHEENSELMAECTRVMAEFKADVGGDETETKAPTLPTWAAAGFNFDQKPTE